MFLIAAFLIYCKQSEMVEAANAERGAFRARLAAAEGSVNDLGKSQGRVESLENQLRQERRDNARLLGDVAALKEEIRKLSQKPYTEAQRNSVQSLVESLRFYERDTLRFLLIYGDSRGDALYASSTSPTGPFDYAWAKVATERGLIRRTEDEAYSHFSLNKELREVLKDLLFPRKEEKPACFAGL